MVSAKKMSMHGGLVLGLLLSVTALPVNVHAQERASRETLVSVNITAQGLEQALIKFGKQTRRPLLFDPRIVQGKRTSGVAGSFTATQALDRLLSGTGLSFKTTPSGALVLVKGVDGGQSTMTLAAYVQTEQEGQADTAPAGALLTSTPAEAAAGRHLEEIVVTAQRRQEAIQSVPIAVTAFSGDTLERRNITQAFQLQYAVPALSLTSPYRDSITNLYIRGLPGVSTYFADVPVNTAAGSSAGGLGLSTSALFFDLENIQVLKGPQGTLFGRNSTGGAILVQPHKPTDEFGGYISGTFGRFDRRKIEGVLNLPINDAISARFAAVRETQDGFTRQVSGGPRLDDKDYMYFRGSLRIQPSSNFENTTVADYYESENHSGSSILTAINPSMILAAFRPSYEAYLAQQNAIGPRASVGQSKIYGDPHRKQILWKIINTTEWKLSDTITLRNIIGFHQVRERVHDDSDGTPLPILEQITPRGTWGRNGEIFTIEPQMRLSLFNQRLDLVVGGFYSSDTPAGKQEQTSLILNNITVSRLNTSIKTKALYAHGIFELTEGLKINAGIRRNWDKQTQRTQTYTGGGICTVTDPRLPAGTVPDGCTIPMQGKWQATGWTLGIDYQASADTLLYFRSGRAYQAGMIGSILRARNPAEQPTADLAATVRPQYYTDVEAGLKADWTIAGRPLRTNLAVFRGWYDDVAVAAQLPIVVVDALGRVRPSSATLNIAKASVKGAEAEITFQPVDGLTLGFNGSYTDAKYQHWDFGGIDIASMNRFAFFPKWKWNVNARFALPVPEHLGDLVLSGDWSHNGRTLLSAATVLPGVARAPTAFEPAYETFNLRLDWNRIGGSPIDASVFVTNLTNKLYRLGSLEVYNISPFGFTTDVYGDPRMWGIQMRYHFGGSGK